MAEDALLKKSADIAVPLEQLGYEMAEELKTNLEKWLPDTPDREKWSQEESLTDKDKEAPMAELPGELEDLIGDLMEARERSFRRNGRRLQQRGRFARQRRGLGRHGRSDLEHERQRRDRQPPAQLPAKSAADRAKDGKENPAASSSATKPWAKAAAIRPAGSRPIRM